MHTKINERQKILAFFWGAVLLLFLSFNFNFFHSVNPKKFYNFQSNSESLIIGKLVKSQIDGALSSQGRLGRYTKQGEDNEANQIKMFYKEIEGGKYEEYNSQFGLQGIIFSYINSFLTKLNVEPKNQINLFHALMSLLLALVISLIIYILYLDLGYEAALVVFLSILLSKWPVYMAKNLYWMLAFMFLPFFIVMLSCALEENGRKVHFFFVALLVMIAVFIKSLMGYEYISTILIAAVTPLIYYNFKNSWTQKFFVSRFIFIGFFSLLGFMLALGLHIYQLEIATGNLSDALNLIKERVLVRTQSSPEIYANTPYYESQQASIFYVLYVFLLKGGSFRLKIPYLFWILVFVYISFKVYSPKITSLYKENNIKILKALVVTVWFSFLAPVSWFIIAKSHSYIHIINYIVWHIPFMIFGFALMGYYWKLKIRKTINKYREKFNLV